VEEVLDQDRVAADAHAIRSAASAANSPTTAAATAAARRTLGDMMTDALAALPDPTALVGQTDTGIEVWWANRAFCEKTKADTSDLVGSRVGSLITTPFGDLPLNDARVVDFPANVIARDSGVSTWVATAVPVTAPSGRAWLVTLRVPSSDRQLDDLLRASEERFSALAGRAPIGIFSSDQGLRFGYANDFLSELVGVPTEQLLGIGWMSFVADDHIDLVSAGLLSTLGGASFESPVRLVTAAGDELWVNLRAVPVQTLGAPAAFLGTVEDVTDRRRFEELLAWQATHDPLTELPNRAQLSEEIERALASDPEQIAVLFFDLDDFKLVNDSLGHRAGDDLLVAVASRLRAAVRGSDRIFRFGGDEFVVLATDVGDDGEAIRIANRLRESVAQPVTLEGEAFSVKCSVGVVRATETATAVELIRDADTAMYEAKRNGKSASSLFDVATRAAGERSLRLVERVRDAVEARELSLEYQPIVDVATQRPVGVEGLLRWHAEEWSDVDPIQVIRAAESAGVIGALTESLIEQACADLAAWRQAIEDGPSFVSINLSADQLSTPGLIDHLTRTLLVNQLGAADLRVELPESAYLDQRDALDPILQELLTIGVGVLLDDVGASVTSLSALVDAPISGIKLDPALLFDSRPGAGAVTRAIVGLAAELGLDVVAEGVEDGHAAELVREAGPAMGQGFAFGHPVIAAAVPSIFGGAAE
jgi:diguanylate cyclase (GGDEF)-like protein/PAS domain S-box-containing protein